MCLYDVEERLLLRRIQISFNRSLDGVLDSLDSRKVTDAGPLALIDDSGSDDDGLLPPVAPGEPGFATMEVQRAQPSFQRNHQTRKLSYLVHNSDGLAPSQV